MDDLSDRDVIAGSGSRPELFGLLFDRYATSMHGYLCRRVGRQAADELLGDLFLTAFERRTSFDPDRGEVRPWMYGIATNLVARERQRWSRNQQRRERIETAAEPVESEFDRVEDALDAQTALGRALGRVESLPDRDRDALVLFASEGLTYEAVAAALGIPVGTVRSRISRARGRLRELAVHDGEQLVDPSTFRKEKEILMTYIATDAQRSAWRGFATRMYPRLAYRDEKAALEYLSRVFGFVERREARVGAGTDDEPMLAWLEFGDGLVMIGRSNTEVHRIESPEVLGGTTTMINVDVDDIDEHHRRAVAEGADVTMALRDEWYGSRVYEATDLEGHRWHFDEPHERILARGGSVPLAPDGD